MTHAFVRAAFLGALAIASPLLAHAQKIDGLPVRPGNTVAEVQAAFNTDQAPVPSQSAVRRDTMALRLATAGVWVFFNKDGKSYTVRLDAPFQGSIGGVKIGSTQTQVIEALGQPARIVQTAAVMGATLEPYVYFLDDGISARIDFDREARVERFLLSKK